MILAHNTKLRLISTQCVVIVCALFMLSGCLGYRYKPNQPSAALVRQVTQDISGIIIIPPNSVLTQAELNHYLANPRLITAKTPSFEMVTIEHEAEKDILYIKGFSRRVHQLDVFNIGYLDDFQIPLKDRDKIVGYLFEYKGYIDNLYFSLQQDKTDKQLPLMLHTTPISSYRIRLIYQNGQTYDFDYRSVMSGHSGRHSYNFRADYFYGDFAIIKQNGRCQLQPFPAPSVDLIPQLVKSLPGAHIIKDGHAYPADKKLAKTYLSRPKLLIEKHPPAFDLVDIQERNGKFYLHYQRFDYNLSDISIYKLKDYKFYGIADNDPVMGYLFDYQTEILDIAYLSRYNYLDPNFSLSLFTKPQTPLYIQLLYADGRVIKKKYQSTFYLKDSKKERFAGFHGELSIYQDTQSDEFTIIKF